MNARAKHEILRNMEGAGEIADSMEVRRSLIEQMDAGLITLEEVQRKLAAIKRGAKAQGKVTRNQAWRSV